MKPFHQQLTELIAELRQLRAAAAKDGAYRRLIRCADEHHLDADVFGERLRQAGLHASTASKLAKLYSSAEARSGFLHPQTPLSFRAACRCAAGQPAATTTKSVTDRDARLQEKLAKDCAQLLAQWPAGIPCITCGVFVLAVAGEPPAPRDPATGVETRLARLELRVAPETEELLRRLARRSSLTIPQTAGLLLDHAPLDQLVALTEEHARRVGQDPSARQNLLRANPAAQKLSRTNAAPQNLRRTKNKIRSVPDVWRFSVPCDQPQLDRLRQVAEACGLSLAELANWLLEPEPVERVQHCLATLRELAGTDPTPPATGPAGQGA